MNLIELKYKPESIPQNKKYFTITGYFWLVLGLIGVYIENSIGYFYLVTGLLYLYPMTKMVPEIFATINDNMYKRNYWLASKTDLSAAKYVKKFAGDITFVFHHKEIRIDGQLLDDESLTKLDEFIEKQQIKSKVIPVR